MIYKLIYKLKAGKSWPFSLRVRQPFWLQVKITEKEISKSVQQLHV